MNNSEIQDTETGELSKTELQTVSGGNDDPSGIEYLIAPIGYAAGAVYDIGKGIADGLKGGEDE